jgi:hypothetical protein
MILSILTLHLLLPLFFVLRMWRGAHAGRMRWSVTLFAGGSFLAFAIVSGAWAWVGYPLRLLWPLLFLGAAVLSWRRVGSAPQGTPRPAVMRVEYGIEALLGSLFLALALVGLRGYAPDAAGIDLKFPLADGVYVVGQGGNSPMINGHQASRAQRHALDIVKLNGLWMRAWGLYPGEPERYAIFGDKVLSPCSGTVVDSRDGLPDQSPPVRDAENLAGNYVAIECRGAVVLLAHFKRGSLKVGAQDRVEAGQPLAQVGNTGNTSEPHLHIHAEPLPYEGLRSTKAGLPMRFGGRYLVRNSVVVSRG